MLAMDIDAEPLSVLLVEDSRNDAKTTVSELRAAAKDWFNIHHVTTLKEALTKIPHYQPNAILLDLGLPDSDGLHSIVMLGEHCPEAAIIVLSGRADEMAVLQSLRCGAQEFLLKGECSGQMMRQTILTAMIRKRLDKET